MRLWRARGPGRPAVLAGSRPWSACGQQRQAAQRDAREDGSAADDLQRAGRVAEDNDARHGADERLQVEKGPRDLSGYPALPVGEEREGQQGACGREPDGGRHGARAAGGGWHALGNQGDRARGDGSSQELRGGDSDRIAAVQQAALRHRERG
jgi:hypothetical protein